MLENDIDKYNEPPKLQKANSQMTSSPSECLVSSPREEKNTTLEDFKIIKVIGKGSFGKVFLVSNKNMNKFYAMKRINKDILIEKHQIINIKNEKEILIQIQHPFINSLDFVFQNELRIYFFLNYLPGGDIYDNLSKVQRFEEFTVRFIGAQIVLAMGHLHKNKIVHRDLKPENVLMNRDGYVCLADFGLAKFLNPNETTNTFCGTADYMAPEILDCTGYNKSVDWWTLGILLYEMATGIPPFMNSNIHKVGKLIKNAKIIFPDPEKHKIYMSKELKDIILKVGCCFYNFLQLLERDPNKRLGSGPEDANEIMSHPFFQDFDWDGLINKRIEARYIPDLKIDEELSALLDKIEGEDT